MAEDRPPQFTAQQSKSQRNLGTQALPSPDAMRPHLPQHVPQVGPPPQFQQQMGQAAQFPHQGRQFQHPVQLQFEQQQQQQYLLEMSRVPYMGPQAPSRGQVAYGQQMPAYGQHSVMPYSPYPQFPQNPYMYGATPPMMPYPQMQPPPYPFTPIPPSMHYYPPPPQPYVPPQAIPGGLYPQPQSFHQQRPVHRSEMPQQRRPIDHSETMRAEMRQEYASNQVPAAERQQAAQYIGEPSFTGPEERLRPQETATFAIDPSLTRITFNVRCVTCLDERVAIAGNHQALGDWDALRAVKMHTDRATYPIWTGNADLPRGAQLEYKFIKTSTSQTGNLEVDWEALPTGNRTVKTLQRAKVVLTERFSDAFFRWEEILPASVAVSPNQSMTVVSQSQETGYTSGPPNASRLSPQLSPLMPTRAEAQVLPPRFATPPEPPVAAPRPVLQQPAPLKIQVTKGLQARDMPRQLDQPTAGSPGLKPKLAAPSPRNLNYDYPKAPRLLSQKEVPVRKLLEQQLLLAFPEEMQGQLQRKMLQKAVTSNASDFSNGHEDQQQTRAANSPAAARRKSTLSVSRPSEKMAEVQLDPAECIILCTYSLPYTLQSTEPGVFTAEKSYASPSFVYASLDDLAQRKIYTFIWVGIVCTRYKLTEKELVAAKKALREKNCYGVFYTEEELRPFLEFYEGQIRPNMHNFIDPDDAELKINERWTDFKDVNFKIAQRVHELRTEFKSNTVWIHGDQFIILPLYIRNNEILKANIGFYFHQAFPASAIFHSFHHRNQILQSLLHSNLIGFHVFEYARNFLNCCRRTLGLQCELGTGNSLSVNYNKTSVQVRVSHIGLDESFVRQILDSAAFQKEVKRFSNQIRYETQNETASSRASLNRGNPSQLQSRSRFTHAASQPAMLSRSIASTVASSDQAGSGCTTPLEEDQERIILSSIDSFHSMTGIVLKLKGYRSFLKANPDYKDKVTLIQIIRGLFTTSSNMMGEHVDEDRKQQKPASEDLMLSEHVPALKVLKEEVHRLVSQIHKDFGKKCLIVKTANYSIEARMALWSKTNILFVSTLKDGLYLTCFEYIWAKYVKGDFKNSAMLLSEFTGCNSQFAGFHEFNPFLTNISLASWGKTTVSALEEALKESPRQKEVRMRRAFKFCQQRTFSGWVEHFLKELKLAYNPHSIEETRIVYSGLHAVRFAKQRSNVAAQSNLPGATPQSIRWISTVPNALNIKQHASYVKSGRKNLILIDHEAIPFIQFTKWKMQPREEILHQLVEIIQDKNNIVCVLSDQDKNYVEQVFAKALVHHENFWMSAESGYWRMAAKHEWQPLFQLADRAWIRTIRTIMEDYCDNIDGATVEERSCSIVWNYRVADDDLGQKFAKELYTHLKQLVGHESPLDVRQGNGYIEVLPRKLTRQRHLGSLFQEVRNHAKQKIESLLYIGADLTDDAVFAFIQSQVEEDRQHSLDGHRDYSEQTQKRVVFSSNCKTSVCVMGKRPSSAPCYLEQRDLGLLLQQIALSSQLRKKNASTTDLLAEKLRLQQEQEDLGNDPGGDSPSGFDPSRRLEQRRGTIKPRFDSSAWFEINPRYTPDETIHEQDPLEESSQIPVDDKLASDKKGTSKETLAAPDFSIHSMSHSELPTKPNSGPAILDEDEPLTKFNASRQSDSSLSQRSLLQQQLGGLSAAVHRDRKLSEIDGLFISKVNEKNAHELKQPAASPRLPQAIRLEQLNAGRETAQTPLAKPAKPLPKSPAGSGQVGTEPGKGAAGVIDSPDPLDQVIQGLHPLDDLPSKPVKPIDDGEKKSPVPPHPHGAPAQAKGPEEKKQAN